MTIAASTSGRRLIALALMVAVGGCRTAPGPTPVETTHATVVPDAAATTPAPLLPEASVGALEHRLLVAKRVHLVFEVESHGEVETKLRGILVLGPDGRALLEAQGTFAGRSGAARIECDGRTLRGHSGAARLEMPCPTALRPALALGLVRMGVLHNLARAWSAKPPDRADAVPPDTDPGAAMNAWVTTTHHRRPKIEAAPDPGADRLAFDIVVDGEPVGDATLVLDAAGLPVSREQIVRFPGGEMRVVERYEGVDVSD